MCLRRAEAEQIVMHDSNVTSGDSLQISPRQNGMPSAAKAHSTDWV